jgi:PAS domain S-box-containing protein
MGCRLEEPEIVRELRESEKKGLLKYEPQKFGEENNKISDDLNTRYKFVLSELREIIDFTERLSLKLYGDFTIDDVYKITLDELQKSDKYSGSFLLLTDDKKHLKILGTSHKPGSFFPAERLTGHNVKNYEIPLEKSHIYNQVINENKTIIFALQDLMEELFPKKLAPIICKMISSKKTKHVATPIKLDGKTIGAFAMSSSMFNDIIIPSMKNLGLHITNALEYAMQNTERKQTMERLTETERKIGVLVKQSLQGLVILQDFRIIYANDKIAEITGYTIDELLSFHQDVVKSLVHPDDQKLVWGSMQARLKGENIAPNYEFRGIRKDGSTYWLEIYASRIEYKGKPAVQGAIIDITDRKKAELELKESKDHFQKLFSTMVDPIVIVDSDGKFLDINKKVEEVTGLQRDYLIGKNFLKIRILTRKSKAILLKKLLLRMAGKKLKPYEVEIITKDRGKKPYEINAQKIEYFGKPADIVSFRDMSERKKAEKKLKEAHKKLQELNQELEKKVDQRTSEIQHLLHQKDEFINQLGHDLKNPLTPLVNLLPILEKGEMNPRNKDMLNIVIRNVEYMKNLVTKTIVLAKLSSDKTKFSFKEVNLFEEFEKNIVKNKFIFEENNIHVINYLGKNIKLTADRLRIEELLDNIFNNAVKYSTESGLIIINAKKDDNFATISIKDNGIGMTKEQIKYVFDEFYKADESRHDFDSTGLGMPICKRIVEKHGGKIWVDSDGNNKGTTVYFTLPLTRKKLD